MSEQTPSAVGLGVMVDTDCTVKYAGGFMIQLMPDATEEVISSLEKRINEMPTVTTLMSEGKTPEDILGILLEGLDFRLNDGDSEEIKTEDSNKVGDVRVPVCFKCNCSEDRMLKALATIKKSDLQEMIDDNEDVEVVCHFCNMAYNITVDKLRELLNN